MVAYLFYGTLVVGVISIFFLIVGTIAAFQENGVPVQILTGVGMTVLTLVIVWLIGWLNCMLFDINLLGCQIC